MGVVDILSGDYAKAVKDIKDTKGCCKLIGLANLLNGDLEASAKSMHCNDADCNYIRAIIAARQGNATDVKKYLDLVAKDDPELAARAEKDVEFAEFR